MLTGETQPARYFARIEDGLAFMSARFGDLDTPLPDPPTAAEPDDDALTVAYVMEAIERYESEGPEAAFAYYNNRRSHEGERALFVINQDSLLSVAPFPALVGSPLGLGRGAFPAREEIIGRRDLDRIGWLESCHRRSVADASHLYTARRLHIRLRTLPRAGKCRGGHTGLRQQGD